MSNVIWLKEKFFFKSQQAIERNNYSSSENHRTLAMALDLVNQQSPRSGLLLRDYYRRIERNPKLGLSQLELTLLVRNNLNDDGTFTCTYCEKKFSGNLVTIDHFKPQMFRGKNHFHNLRLSCFKCNTMKGAIHPFRMPNVFNLFKERARSDVHSSCIKLLVAAKELFHGKDFIETQLLERLLLVENYWRDKDTSTATELVEA